MDNNRIIENNKKYTIIDNQYIKNSDKVLTAQELTILTLMRMNLSVNNKCIFTIDSILNNLKLTSNNNRKREQIKDFLYKLYNEYQTMDIFTTTIEDDKYIIHDYKSINKNQLLYADFVVDEPFTIIYDEDIYKIIEYCSSNKIDYNLMINLYIYISSFINCDNTDINYKLCFLSYETINDELGLSENTIIKYLSILNELNILRNDYSGYKETSKGIIKNDKMYYCRYEDESLLIYRLNQIRLKEGYIKINSKSKDKSNLKRSIKQKINDLYTKIENRTITKIEFNNYNILIDKYKKIIQGEDF